jgi:hypothetical protein
VKLIMVFSNLINIGFLSICYFLGQIAGVIDERI